MTFQIEFQPTGKRLLYEPPVSIFEAAREAGIGLKSVCGGKGTCGKCIIRVVKGQQVSAVTVGEKTLLLPDEIERGYRQACRTVVSGDTQVYIPAASLTIEQKMQITGMERKITVCSPVRKYFVELSRANLTDVRSDFKRVSDALKDKYGVGVARADVEVLRAIGPMLRDSDWALTVAVREDEIVALEPSDTTSRSVGLAVDLGTTRIALYLVDLLSGETIEARGIINPQIAYGEDVISRIEAIMADASNLDRLRGDVVTAINGVVKEMCRNQGLRPKDILELSLVGNTAMHHIFLGLPTCQLALSPFVPITTTALTLKARHLGLKAAPGGYLYILPPVASFVGSDLVAVLLATDLSTRKEARLAIDLGTNTEIALQAGEELMACSCACGPAFEGAHISFGMRATPGAIERVRIDERTLEVHIATVGDEAPLGLCGSGILDCIAEMLRVGLLDTEGRLQPGRRGIRPAENGKLLEFVLFGGERGNGRQDITVSQQDIEQIQLAKGAIRAGIDLLLEELGIEAQELDGIVVAGAFGTYLDPMNAVRIGLLPDLPLQKIRFVGNAAGVGAKLVLISKKKRREAITLARRVRYIELASHPRFAPRFAQALRFDGPDRTPSRPGRSAASTS